MLHVSKKHAPVQHTTNWFYDWVCEPGGRIRILFKRASFQKALLRACIFQRTYSGATQVRCGGLEHPLRVDELGFEGGDDAGLYTVW